MLQSITSAIRNQMPRRRALLAAFREAAADEGALFLRDALRRAGVNGFRDMTNEQLEAAVRETTR